MICSVSFASASAESWTTKASMNHARAYLGVAALNGRIYAIGGDKGSETCNCGTGTGMTFVVSNCTEEYDPIQNLWTQKADMPTARAHFGTGVVDGKIYCIGGYNGANGQWETEYYDLKANEAYDPVLDTWSTLAALPTPRFNAATNVVDGKIYVIGGHTMTDLFVTLNVTEVYDPVANSWTTKTPAPLNVGCSASAVVDGKIYVLGEDPNVYLQYIIMIYDPAADSWTVKTKAPVNYAASAAAATGVNATKRIYFFDENRTDIYNPATDSWSTGTAAPTDRLIAKAVTLNDSIYLIGGRTGQWGYITLMYPTALTEQYLPENGTPYATTPASTTTPTLSPSPSPLLTLTTATPTQSALESNQPPGPQSLATSECLTLPVLAAVLVVIVSVFVIIGVWSSRHKATA
ncbi:MAG: PQQ-binding-like beta-propeller repeat protein [Candidatus Bathyarchaeota archaeon]|nr:PQQ-binding-like beta-propeller repeat protein [Candidatus Bathyarchaeota archaeon]